MTAESYAAFRARVHQRVCVPARSCTCPAEVTPGTLDAARARAALVHAKFTHLGMPDACQSPHDVICKAVWS